MGPLQTICRVTVYAEAVLEESLLNHFLEMGSNGYTVVDCRGKGEHEPIGDPFTGSENIRIELLVQRAVGERILEYLHSGQFQSRAVAACLETVQVAEGERF